MRPEQFKELPSVGVSPHDLRCLALNVAQAFGVNTHGGVKAEELLSAAINQACFDLETVAEAIGDSCAHYQTIYGIKERIGAVLEIASIVSTLSNLSPGDAAP